MRSTSWSIALGLAIILGVIGFAEVLTPWTLSRRDHTGQVVPSTPPAPVTVDRAHLPASSSGPPNHAVMRRSDGTIVAAIDADAWPLGWTRSGGEVRLALMISGTPRTVALYRSAISPPTPPWATTSTIRTSACA